MFWDAVHLAVGRAKIQHQQFYNIADVEGGSGQGSDTHSRMQCADAASSASFQVGQQLRSSAGITKFVPDILASYNTSVDRTAAT